MRLTAAERRVALVLFLVLGVGKWLTPPPGSVGPAEGSAPTASKAARRGTPGHMNPRPEAADSDSPFTLAPSRSTIEPPVTAASIAEAPDSSDVGDGAAQLVDPNRANAMELESLPGIGPGIAGRIVLSRDLQGPFRSAEDLRRVRGIGPSRLSRIRPWLHFGEASAHLGAHPADHPKIRAIGNP